VSIPLRDSLSIIIPSYREAENLEVLLPELKKSMETIDVDYEVFVIDALQKIDETEEICKKNEFFHIHRKGGSKYGDAIRTGVKHANNFYSIIMDADGSHDPAFISKLWKWRNSYDIVIASRYITGGKTENNFILNFMSKVLNISYSIVLGIKCKDISNSFKLYQTNDLKSITLKCNEFDIVEEIIFKINKIRKIALKEIPFNFQKRNFGKSKRNLIIFIFKYLITLIKLRFFV